MLRLRKYARRDLHEREMLADVRINQILWGVQLKLIQENMDKDMGQRGGNRTSVECSCYGPTQALFVMIIGTKGRTEPEALTTNKVDSSSLSKFLLKVEDVFEKGAVSGAPPPPQPKKKKKKGKNVPEEPVVRKVLLFEAIASGKLQLPRHAAKISATELDLVFARSKEDSFSGSFIGYKEFVKCVDALAYLHYTPKKLRITVPTKAKTKATATASFLDDGPGPGSPGASTSAGLDLGLGSGLVAAGGANEVSGGPSGGGTADDSSSVGVTVTSIKDASVGKGGDGSVGEAVQPGPPSSPTARPPPPRPGSSVLSTAQSAAELSGSLSVASSSASSHQKLSSPGAYSVASTPNSTSTVKPTITTAAAAAAPTKTVNKKLSRFDDPSQLQLPLSLINGDQPNFHLSMFIKFLTSQRANQWMLTVANWMEEESRARVGHFVIRIQCLARRRLARNRVRDVRLSRVKEAAQQEYKDKIVRVQSVIRRFLGRRKVIRRAQKFIIKYVPHDARAYWYHPSTRVSSWTKPKILGSFDCLSLAVPPAGLESTVKCSHCLLPAKVNCAQCEESYCQDCYDSLHCKGNRRRHHKLKIPMCSYCKFQVAGKNCLTCTLIKPKPDSAQASLKESERGLYCDLCFIHHHDAREKKLELNPDRKLAERNLLYNSKDAYLIRQQIQQRVDTSHRFDNLVQSCEECLWRCASWRCVTCTQIYCHTCLVGLHSMGGPFGLHKAEPIPYFTPEMHKSYQYDWREQRMQAKTQYLSRMAAKKREEFRFASILLIQRWWRGRWYGRQGKKHMRIQRLKRRRKFLQRKRETAQIRSTDNYKFWTYFGMGPELPSDTNEEKVLNRLRESRRKPAKKYIDRNLEDWGHYRVSSSDPKKGVPRTGFDVGTIPELLDQARRGGWRLPGRLHVLKGSRAHKTTMDMSNIVKVGDILRLNDWYYNVHEVTTEQITFDDKWFLESPPTNPIVVYRMPAYPGEEGHRYYQNRIFLRQSLMRNFLVQGAVRTYIYVNKVLVRKSIQMARTAVAGGAMEDARAWRKYASKCSKRAKRMKLYLKTRDSKVDGEEQEEEDDDANAELENAKKKTKNAATAAAKGRGAAGGNDDDTVDGDVGSALTGDDAGENLTVVTGVAPKYKRKPGERWVATPEEFQERKEREEHMSPEDLAAEAHVWVEEIDPLNDMIFFVHKETCEIIYGVPRSVASFRMLEETKEKNRKMAEDAQQRIDQMLKLQNNKLKIGGGRKKK